MPQDNPENALVLPKWSGDNSDRSLISLAQFLQEIGSSDVDDVREVLTYYRQFDDPIEAFRWAGLPHRIGVKPN